MNGFYPKILIVDDSSENLKLLGNSLKKNNFIVLTALNGKQAIALADSKKPDLILLDVMMPEMDGFEVCERLKVSPESADIPVIFLSALSQPENIKSGFELGAVDYAIKPFNIDNLLLKITTQLKIKHQTDYINNYNDILVFLLDEILSQKKDLSALAIDFIAKELKYFQYLNGIFNVEKIKLFFQNYYNIKTEVGNNETSDNNNCMQNYIGLNLTQFFLNTLIEIITDLGIVISNAKINMVPVYENKDILNISFQCNNKYQNAINGFINTIKNNSAQQESFKIDFLLKIILLANSEIRDLDLSDNSGFQINIPLFKKYEHNKLSDPYLTEKSDLSCFKVLIVEDNELNQEYLKSLLQQFNLQFDICSDGESAIELQKNANYDLILLDLSLPGISGLEVASALRQKYDYKKPIISISGHTDRAMTIKCLESGFNGFLQKPFKLIELENIFLKYLNIDSTEEIELLEEKKEVVSSIYDCFKAIELANGNDEMLKQWLTSFCGLLSEAKLTIKEIREKQEYNKGVKVFHDLINYASYFKINKIIDSIIELQNLKKGSPEYKTEINKCLDLFELEVNLADTYYLDVLRSL